MCVGLTLGRGLLFWLQLYCYTGAKVADPAWFTRCSSSLATGLCQDQFFRRRVPSGWISPFLSPILLTSKQCLSFKNPMSRQP
ncbi:rCG52109 [Rattus norvegicus]|uniref:RCG52109 n=1 Tax=Rattus norvegicus TaxID=10116 RepID=A6K6H6_RAT|nr:rCG52109 [Rattus norvegicus]